MLGPLLLLAVAFVFGAKVFGAGDPHLIRALVNQEKDIGYGKAKSQPGELYAIIALHTCR